MIVIEARTQLMQEVLDFAGGNPDLIRRGLLASNKRTKELVEILREYGSSLP